MKKKTFFLGLILITFMAALVSITLGAASITPIEALHIIVEKIIGNGETSVYEKIIFNIRLPRIILAALVGIGLSVTGASFQGLFKNPMADPYVLGVSSGAALGATLSIVFRLESSGLGLTTIYAFLGALFSIMLVYNIAKVGSKLPATTLLLAGIAVNFLFSSMISISMILHREAMERIIYWTMGSFNSASYKQITFIAPIVIVISCIFYSNYRALNIMAVGDESAYTLGVDGEKIKKRIIILSSIMVASIVSVSGIIGFVGLIIPHASRMIVGSNHRELIPFSAVLGALFVIICDTLSRALMPPMELPVGAITSLFGAPYFIFLLWKRKRG
ncbi:corrinoid ABC transporter permease [Clostridium polyendosporum]|uniref:Corrinoid ABC transporter permease n=1 Tax=Clostridium polyendosporum TaxID=69208 RepID=A0A919RYM5_9CLOT|nr:iron ABC transporter permease [Clostridium polyendosporum]GIM28174.1 corrinoid ABC transporter permease [Clostridium polyendosporum]